MKINITIEENDLRNYIEEMLAKNGLKPTNTDYKFDVKKKTYTIECEPAPIPEEETRQTDRTGVDLEFASAAPRGAGDETDDSHESDFINDSQNDEADEILSLADLRATSDRLATAGPRSTGRQPANAAHRRLASQQSSLMVGESTDPPVGGK